MSELGKPFCKRFCLVPEPEEPSEHEPLPPMDKEEFEKMVGEACQRLTDAGALRPGEGFIIMGEREYNRLFKGEDNEVGYLDWE